MATERMQHNDGNDDGDDGGDDGDDDGHDGGDYVFRTDQSSKGMPLDPKLAVMQVAVLRNKKDDIKSSGISRSPKLLLMLHLLSHLTKSD